MKDIKKRIWKIVDTMGFQCIAIAIVGVLLLVFSIFVLKISRIPPNKTKAEKILIENYDDIETVTNYMFNSQYAYIYISDDDGTMLADLEQISIDDTDVRTSITNLFREIDDLYFSKSGNSICIGVWSNFQNISSCLGRTIDYAGIPPTQHPTEITPLSVQGWYYIIEDYNKAVDSSLFCSE